MPLGTRRRASFTEAEVPVVRPYRLDLTAAVLRRSSTNVVDILGNDGAYRRALGTPRGPVVVEAVQVARDALRVRITGPAATHAGALDAVRRMLATEVRVEPFLRASSAVPWLAPLAARMRGVHPPRYPTLWEACVNAVVFQQVSLFAASAMLRRLIEALGTAVWSGGALLHVFPGPTILAAADPDVLRVAGLSAAKASTLRGIAEALAAGVLDEPTLERASSGHAAEILGSLKGIGPWTAAIVLLRGLGRLDVFPQNDSGAARSLAFVTGGKPIATEPVLELLGDQRGMLYYHLLLARLEARGDLPSPA